MGSGTLAESGCNVRLAPVFVVRLISSLRSSSKPETMAGCDGDSKLSVRKVVRVNGWVSVEGCDSAAGDSAGGAG